MTTLCVVGIAACAPAVGAPAATNPSSAGNTFHGFAYTIPADAGWTLKQRGTHKEFELVVFEKPASGRTFQIQLTRYRPVRQIATADDLTAWTQQGAAGDKGSAQPDASHGAVCARYSTKWSQTMSVNGGARKPSADLDEFGLQCIDPQDERMLVQFRYFERSAPGDLSGAASVEAGLLLRSVTYTAGR